MEGYSIRELEAFAARFYQGYDLLLTPYGYPAVFGSLAQGASQTLNVNIAANADFIALGLRHRVTVGVAVGQTVSNKPAPFLRLLITDTGSAEQFTSQAVDLENYSTNGVGERNLPYPRICAGRTALSLQLTNYAPAAETYSTTEIFLSGLLVRAYTAGSARGAVPASA